MPGPARRSPEGWSTTTPSSCPRCSAGPRPSWPRRSARATNVRSSTAMTSYSSRKVLVMSTVQQQASDARGASIDLAAATRAEKDEALLLMADRLVERTEDIVAANAVDVNN